MPFRALALTLFPEMFPGPLGYSLAGKALEKGLWQLDVLNIRDFSTDKHQKVDDTAYGGGTGMVMKPDVVDAAINAARSQLPDATLIYFTPRGQKITQSLVKDLSTNDLILLCGRFEAVDERVIEKQQPLELSLGDFILSGGEPAAIALLDACLRYVSGVIQDESVHAEESFAPQSNYARLLEYPHYTKPLIWEDRSVPEVLLSGHHVQIETWRLQQAEQITKARRPDIWIEYLRHKGQDHEPD